MGFQFAETMSGTIEWDAAPGVRHPFSFEVTATARSLRAHLRDGKAALRGVIHAPPAVPTADAEGTITIRLVGPKLIRYELVFAADGGARYTLVGQKNLRYLAPTRSFTHLPAEIFDSEHRRVATCEATFDLAGDGLRFARSFRRV